MSEADFANQYIERVLNEVVELTKIRLMSETRIAYLEKQVAALVAKLEEANENPRERELDPFDHESMI
jgi:hypothetical protein